MLLDKYIWYLNKSVKWKIIIKNCYFPRIDGLFIAQTEAPALPLSNIAIELWFLACVLCRVAQWCSCAFRLNDLHSWFRATRELLHLLLSKPSAFPCSDWPRDPPPDQWEASLELLQPMRRGCCNASRGHYCTGRNAAEEGGDVGAGPAFEQAHQQVRKIAKLTFFEFFQTKVCVALGKIGGRFVVNFLGSGVE